MCYKNIAYHQQIQVCMYQDNIDTMPFKYQYEDATLLQYVITVSSHFDGQIKRAECYQGQVNSKKKNNSEDNSIQKQRGRLVGKTFHSSKELTIKRCAL